MGAWSEIQKSGERWVCLEGKKSNCSFEHVERKVLLRHLSGNVHEALGKFSKSFPYFHRRINGWPVKMRQRKSSLAGGPISKMAGVASKKVPTSREAGMKVEVKSQDLGP